MRTWRTCFSSRPTPAHQNSRCDAHWERVNGAWQRCCSRRRPSSALLVASAAFLGWASARLPPDLPRAGSVHLDGAAILFTLACVALSAVVATLAPVFASSSKSVQPALAAGGRGGAVKRSRTASILIGAEVAVAVVVVVGAGLMLRSLEAFAAVDPGFEARGVVTVRVSPPAGRYDGDEAVDQLYAQILGEVTALPDIASAGAIMFLPMTSGGAYSRFRVTPEAMSDAPTGSFRIVTPGYFETMNVPLLAGRTFTASDDANGQAVKSSGHA